MKISQILQQDGYRLSFEVFPPKKSTGLENVRKATEEIAKLEPSFVSVTYGAGGGTSDFTLDIAKNIKEQTGEEMENLYITKPVITESPAPDRQSVYAIQKRYIDRLISASMQERIAIISVEPASMAFFRIYGKWAEEMPLVEMFPEHASIITYSPAGGIFLSDAPTLQEKELLADGAKSNDSILTAYAANDFAAGQTYLNVNTDMHYVVLTDNQNILNIPSLRFRLPPEPVAFPEYIDSGSFPKGMELIWMPLAGTLLQAFDDLPESGEFPGGADRLLHKNF